jgi:Asp/Glu/hydantoin racemase
MAQQKRVSKAAEDAGVLVAVPLLGLSTAAKRLQVSGGIQRRRSSLKEIKSKELRRRGAQYIALGHAHLGGL